MNNQFRLGSRANGESPPDELPLMVDAHWLDSHFSSLAERLSAMESVLETLERRLGEVNSLDSSNKGREFYFTQEFSELVDKSTYTVREWCRLGRINAEKSDCGRGCSKEWKIPASELQRYRDHGLLRAVW